MNREEIASEVVKIAKSLTAGNSMLDFILKDRDVGKLQGIVDEQTYDLAVEVYMVLRKGLELNNQQNEAINRLRQCVDRGSSMQPDAHRNNIFKAAHALGIKPPSSMF
jgi:hypothetical protein